MVDGTVYEGGLLNDVDVRKICYMLPRIYHLKGTMDGIRFLMGIFGVNVLTYNWWELKRSYELDPKKEVFDDWSRYYAGMGIEDVKACHIYATILVDVENNPILQNPDDTLILQVQALVSTFTWVCTVLDYINFVAQIPSTHVEVRDEIKNFNEWVRLIQLPWIEEDLYTDEQVDLNGDARAVCFQWVPPSEYMIRYNGLWRHREPGDLSNPFPLIYADPDTVANYKETGCNLWTDYIWIDEEVTISNSVPPSDAISDEQHLIMIRNSAHPEFAMAWESTFDLTTRIESRLRYTGYAVHDGVYTYNGAHVGKILDLLIFGIVDINTNYTIRLIASEDEPEVGQRVLMTPIWSSEPTEVDKTGSWGITNNHGTIDDTGLLVCTDMGDLPVVFTDPAGKTATKTLSVIAKTTKLLLRLGTHQFFDYNADINIPISTRMRMYSDNGALIENGSLYSDLFGIQANYDNDYWMWDRIGVIGQIKAEMTLRGKRAGLVYESTYINAYVWAPNSATIQIPANVDVYLPPQIEGTASVGPVFESLAGGAFTLDPSGQFAKFNLSPGTYKYTGNMSVLLENTTLDKGVLPFELNIRAVASTGTVNVTLSPNLAVVGDVVSANASIPGGAWSISNPSIARIDKNGLIYILKDVSTTLIVSYVTPDGKYGNATLQVVQNIQGIRIQPGSIDLHYGQNYQFNLLRLPRLTPETGTWTTNDPDVTVDTAGRITVVSGKSQAKTVVLTARKGSDVATANINLLAGASSIDLQVGSPLVLNPPAGQTWNKSNIVVTLSPPGSTEQTYLDTSNAGIVSIESMQAVAKGGGTSRITVSSESGLSAVKDVQVVIVPESIVQTRAVVKTLPVNTPVILDSEFYISPIKADNIGVDVVATGDLGVQQDSVAIQLGTQSTQGYKLTATAASATQQNIVLTPDYQADPKWPDVKLTLQTYGWNASLTGSALAVNVATSVPLNVVRAAGFPTVTEAVQWSVVRGSATLTNGSMTGVTVTPTGMDDIYLQASVTIEGNNIVVGAEFSVNLGYTITLAGDKDITAGDAPTAATPTWSNGATYSGSYSSSNGQVVSVNKDTGLYQGVAEGTADVIFTDVNGASARLTVTVGTYDVKATGTLSFDNTPGTDKTGQYAIDIDVTAALNGTDVSNFKVRGNVFGTDVTVDPVTGKATVHGIKVVNGHDDYLNNPDDIPLNTWYYNQTLYVDFYRNGNVATTIEVQVPMIVYPVYRISDIVFPARFPYGQKPTGSAKVWVNEDVVDVHVLGEAADGSAIPDSFLQVSSLGQLLLIAVADTGVDDDDADPDATWNPTKALPLDVGRYSIKLDVNETIGLSDSEQTYSFDVYGDIRAVTIADQGMAASDVAGQHTIRFVVTQGSGSASSQLAVLTIADENGAIIATTDASYGGPVVGAQIDFRVAMPSGIYTAVVSFMGTTWNQELDVYTPTLNDPLDGDSLFTGEDS